MPADKHSRGGMRNRLQSESLSGAEKVLYSFNGSPDGAHPWAGLISFDGAFYGTTFDGGTGVNCSHLYEVAGCGTVFEVSRSGSESVLYSFEGLTDGQFPQASLVATNGALYGNTNSGGESGNGIIFEWSTSGGKSIVYNFKGGSDGSGPEAPLITPNGTLYGTTGGGGTGCAGDIPPGCGTVFEFGPSGESVLYRFKVGRGGEGPGGAGMEMIDVNGALYGTTVSGGRGCNGYGCGTVFEVSTSGGGSILYSFEGGKDGEQPLGGLTDVDGTLYGTTQVGGAHHDWTVFELNPSTGAEQVLYNFEGGKDGADPEAGLISRERRALWYDKTWWWFDELLRRMRDSLRRDTVIRGREKDRQVLWILAAMR